MKTFNKIMKATKEDMRHMHCGDPTRLIAVTRGQILYSKPDDLIMRSCWVKIELQYNCHPQFERGEIVFTPLIQPSDQPKTSVAANSRFLSQLTDRLHEFGGETIIFPPYAEPELQINDPENGQIIRSTKDTTIIPAVKQEIIEIDGGYLAVHNRDYFRMHPDKHFRDQRDHYVSYYNKFKFLRWQRLTAGDVPEFVVNHTNRFATLVPTVWFGPQGCKLYLDFAEDWITSKDGTMVIKYLNPFVITHRVIGDHLVTRTTIHRADSITL